MRKYGLKKYQNTNNTQKYSVPCTKIKPHIIIVLKIQEKLL